MTVKQEIHELVEQFSENEAAQVLAYIRHITSEVDDEELTPDEWAAITEGEAEIARGEYVTCDGLRRRAGR